MVDLWLAKTVKAELSKWHITLSPSRDDNNLFILQLWDYGVRVYAEELPPASYYVRVI